MLRTPQVFFVVCSRNPDFSWARGPNLFKTALLIHLTAKVNINFCYVFSNFPPAAYRYTFVMDGVGSLAFTKEGLAKITRIQWILYKFFSFKKY